MISAVFLRFDWTSLLWGSEDVSFLWEIILRTLIMFLVIILSLRVLGKRGVKQLSVFELVVIIGLGSAAGDPMLYKEVGVISSVIVFSIIILFYRILTFLIGRFKNIENLIEGKSISLIENGVFAIENFKKENLGSDEFFSELRVKGISHLGQVEFAIEETSGEISVFYFDEKNTKYGLPIMLDSLKHPLKYISSEAYYSCTFCGYTEQKIIGEAGTCKHCGKGNWVPSSKRIRIT